MAVLAIDFDGTLTTHKYPLIGKDIGAVPVLKKLLAKEHKLILFTMRGGQQLQEAIDWCTEQGIELYGINVNPSQKFWTSSPKAYANIYIDDAALGCPLLYDDESDRMYVDWVKVEELLIKQGIL